MISSVAAGTRSGFDPDPSSYDTGTTTPLSVDAEGHLRVRAQVTTDEGSFRDDFPGSGLTSSLTGTLTFTSGSATVTGSGTAFTTEIKVGDYIKKTADADTLYARVESVDSATSLTLETTYGGTTSSTTGLRNNWQPLSSGTGASIAVASSSVSLISGTASGGVSRITRAGDYLPYNLLMKGSITQRIANQTAVLGFQDIPGSATRGAYFQFDGASNTVVKCVSQFGSAAADTQTTTVTYANNGTSATTHTYEVDLSANQASYLIDGIVVAIHKDHIPGPYDNLAMTAYITNAATVTTTTLAVDWIYFANVDQVQITNDFVGEPQKVLLMGKNTTTGLPTDLQLDANGNLIVTALTGFNAAISFGDITTAASTQVPVRRTAYTEPASSAAFSIKSANANDTSAGTGARTVTITYFDGTSGSLSTETVTLNGTTCVNSVTTTARYIEKITVTTVGSTGSNVGIITLYTGTGCVTTVGTIAATDNTTLWAHHYVPVGKTMDITGLSVSHNGTTVGSGGVFVIKALALGIANAPDVQVADFHRLYGQSSTIARTYTSPVAVAGPARVVVYVSPETTSSTVYRASLDYFQP
jgi:hypothetical protein